MEKFTNKEMEIYKKLQAKDKRIQRAEAEFWREVDARADEIKMHLNVQTNECETCLDKVAQLYGISRNELLDYISTDKQVSYFKTRRFTN